jgi:hypothetical protein
MMKVLTSAGKGLRVSCTRARFCFRVGLGLDFCKLSVRLELRHVWESFAMQRRTVHTRVSSSQLSTKSVRGTNGAEPLGLLKT